ncbi:MAG: DUF502 domain-containing protein [Verrucomicrobiae bacterium]|nr:DUF502 domain-containing protein [Verrucomicrobiae bacterium]
MSSSPTPNLSENKRHAGTWVRNKFLTGLFVALPILGTLWVLDLIYRLINSRFEPLVIAIATRYRDENPIIHFISFPIRRNGELLYTIPLAGFILTVIFLILLGVFVSNVIGRGILSWLDHILLKLPIISTIYHAAKQVIEAVQMLSRSENMHFSKVALIPYPNTPGKLIGFVTGQFSDQQGQMLYSVFLPTAPNPITGFVMIVKASEIELSNMPIEEATKLIISGGLVTPQNFNFSKTLSEVPQPLS